MNEDMASTGAMEESKSYRAGQHAAAWCPSVCPITGRPFFMWIEHYATGCMVPTYGGPFDSYTLPTRGEDGEFECERYDHDEGAWRTAEVIGLGLRLCDDQHEDYAYGTLAERDGTIDRLTAALREVTGCFDAAYAEGLSEALSETSDTRLKDLMERRVLHAHGTAVSALMAEGRRNTAPGNDSPAAVADLDKRGDVVSCS